jgi:hypothetical protein
LPWPQIQPSGNFYNLGGVVANGCIGFGIQLLPLARKKLVDLVGRMCAHPIKNISEVSEWIDVIQFTTGHKAVNNGGPPGPGAADGIVGSNDREQSKTQHAQGPLGSVSWRTGSEPH